MKTDWRVMNRLKVERGSGILLTGSRDTRIRGVRRYRRGLLFKLFVETLQQEGLGLNLIESAQDLELPICGGFADINVLGGVMVFLHRDLAARTIKADPIVFQDVANFIYIEGACLFDPSFP
jgi:hypothetical protein